MARVVVVGAGVGGLAAAARLRVKGHEVTVLEQGPRAGGKLDRYERDGFVFDSGPSLFTLPAVYRDLFSKTGLSLEESVDLQPLDTAFGYHFPDGTALDLPGVDPGAAARAMGDQLGGRSEADWRNLMERAGLVVRPFVGEGIRVTIGSTTENDRFLAAMESVEPGRRSL